MSTGAGDEGRSAPAPENGAGASADGAPEAREGRTARALVVVRERFDGVCVAFAVAAPDAASFGRDEDVLT
ncbi:hypothetical protein WME98_26380 [Sorangium sp. So ce296]|uniref:hypothetical protein n=1 Tax=Sorangium sp. So ce296 TaxID=3133296 RepID=UPI003F5F0CF8